MKNKVIRTIIAITMALTIALICMPVSLAAQTNGKCGENINWAFDDATGTLKISGSGEIELYTLDDEGEIQGENPFEDFYGEIKTVEIVEGITGIGSYAFANCPKVTNFVLPQSIGFIGDGAFENCDSLKVIHLPAVEDLGWAIFCDCDSLQNVIFAEGTKYIPMATFKSCDSLEEIYIPESVESVDESAFADCGTLYPLYAGSNESFVELFKPVTDTNENGLVMAYDVALEDIVYNDDGTIDVIIDYSSEAEEESSTLTAKTIIIIASAAIILVVVVTAVIIVKKKKASEKEEKDDDKNKEYLTY